MTKEQFWKNLKEVILLLIALHIFDVIIVLATPIIVGTQWIRIFMDYRDWIGKVIFGLIVFYKLRHQKIAISVGLLSVMMPIFGGLFYLMTITLTQTDK